MLFAFASILSHKNSNTYLTSLLEFNENNVGIPFEKLSQSYLPGMINPLVPQVESMKELLEKSKGEWKKPRPFWGTFWMNDKYIWKCSDTCDFYFEIEIYENKEKGEKCPICGQRSIGYAPKNKPFDYHKCFSKDEGRTKMREAIQEYTKKYEKGYFNLDKDIEDFEKQGFNVLTSTTNILNFISNSLIIILNELKIPENNLTKLTNETTIIEDLRLRNRKILEKIESKWPDTKSTLFINMFIQKICSFKDFVLINNLDEYLKFEKSIEDQITNPTITNLVSCLNNYKRGYGILDAQADISDSVIKYINEDNKDNCRKYGLAYFLRLENSSLDFFKLKDEFDHTHKNSIDCPIINFIFLRHDYIKHFDVVLTFKEFLDEFHQRHNRELERNMISNLSIEEFFTNKSDQESFKKLKIFIQKWNKFVEMDPDIRYKNEKIELKKIEIGQEKLISILPNTKKEKNGIRIVLGIKALVQVQNQMLNSVRPSSQGGSQICSWDSLSQKSFFRFDESAFVEKMNLDCLLTHTDYGTKGARKMHFKKLEENLFTEISSLKLFKADHDFIPEFDYKNENFSPDLIKLRDGHIQQMLTSEKETEFETEFKDENGQFKVEMLRQILDFCEKLLIPRTLSLTRSENDLNVFSFIQITMPDEIKQTPTFLEIFRKLNIYQVFSFFLLVEEFLFKGCFEKVENPNTRFHCGENFPDSRVIIRNANLILKRSSQILNRQEDRVSVEKGLMRLIVRIDSHPQSENLETPLKFFISNASLYDISFEMSLLSSFTVDESIKLKHCLIFLRLFGKWSMNLQSGNSQIVYQSNIELSRV